MEPQVRNARPNDVDELARLRWNMHTEEEAAAEDYDAFVARFRLFAEEAIGSGSWRIWVAELDRRIIANLWLQLVARVPRPINEPSSALAYLTNVYVEPTYRNAGLGSRMLRELTDWCREHPIAVVVVWPSERSVDYYRREGFSAGDSLQVSLRDE